MSKPLLGGLQNAKSSRKLVVVVVVVVCGSIYIHTYTEVCAYTL